MEKTSYLSEYLDDPEFFNMAKEAIEKDLSNLKRIVDKINQMRVENAYLESDLIVTIDSKNWQNISELIGIAPMKLDIQEKK